MLLTLWNLDLFGKTGKLKANIKEWQDMARMSKAFFQALCSFGAVDQFAKCQGPSSKVPLPGPNYSVRMCQDKLV
jgi:hypothetical protein